MPKYDIVVALAGFITVKGIEAESAEEAEDKCCAYWGIYASEEAERAGVVVEDDSYSEGCETAELDQKEENG